MTPVPVLFSPPLPEITPEKVVLLLSLPAVSVAEPSETEPSETEPAPASEPTDW